MTNGTADEQEKVKEEVTPTPGLVYGEVHIVVDPKTGAMSVNSPPNHLVGLALIEGAKVLIISQMQAAMRQASQPPTIVRAGAHDLSKLPRPS